MEAANFHATALLLGEHGVLIAGEAGSGKTTLALALLDRFGAEGGFARLVSDDQVLLRAVGGRLICRVPPTIAALVEVRGVGPTRIKHEPQMVVDFVIRLLPPRSVERVPEVSTELLAGCRIPCLYQSAGNARGAMLAVASRLSCPPFR